MFINIARLAWCFDISEYPDKPVDIRKDPTFALLEHRLNSESADNFTPGFLSAPKPFECKITPRDANVEKVLREEMAEAEGIFKMYEV